LLAAAVQERRSTASAQRDFERPAFVAVRP
jgi:hypothetical protein